MCEETVTNLDASILGRPKETESQITGCSRQRARLEVEKQAWLMGRPAWDPKYACLVVSPVYHIL